MSIATEVSRLKNAKSAIAAAIAGKGVTVPDATLLDGMAALIEAIEAGGGLSIGGSDVVFGSFTPEADIKTTYTVQHDPVNNRSVTNDIVMVWASANTFFNASNDWEPYKILAAIQIASKTSNNINRNWCVTYSIGSSVSSASATFLIDYADENFKSYFKIKATAQYKLAAGTKYYWIRIGGIA